MLGIDFYFDYRSPYAYLAHSQLRKLGADISYRPFDIRAVMEMVGNTPTSVTCKPKNRYIQADLRRWAEHYGAPFQRHPRMLGLDFKRLSRATLLAADRGPVGGSVTALFDALCAVPEPLEDSCRCRQEHASGGYRSSLRGSVSVRATVSVRLGLVWV